MDATHIDHDLALRLRIESLMADYVHCIDGDRLEEWPAFFVEAGCYRVTTRENHELGLPINVLYCSGQGMLRDRISALRSANIYEPQVYCHLVGSIKLIESAAGEHRTLANFTVTRTMADGAMSLFACGRYVDRIVEDAGVLRFRERLVVLDSRRIDTLLAIPL
jgi:anthranilate 1,2-dioxygenase small subunit